MRIKVLSILFIGMMALTSFIMVAGAQDTEGLVYPNAMEAYEGTEDRCDPTGATDSA